MSKYYYHGVKGSCFGVENALKILKTGGIKCKRLLHMECCGYNGLDYVSICKKEQEKKYITNTVNGFYGFVQNSFCFIISDSIEAIKTEMPNSSLDYDEEPVFKRYSDMFDEWQVREQIPLSAIVGIGIPVIELETLFELYPSSLKELQDLKEILSLSEKMGLDIIDSSEFHFVEVYESQKESGKRIAIKVKL